MQPKYMQIKLELEKKIRDGDYGAGCFLPSESELTAEYKTSRNTVRTALKELMAEGFLEKHRGRASRVLSSPAVSGHKNRIAWLDLERIVNPLYFEVFKETSSYSLSLGYSVDYISVMNQDALERFFSHKDQYVGTLYSNVPDIHLVPKQMRMLYELPNLVGIDQNNVMLSDSYVLTDNAAGAAMAVQYLLDTGHRHILYSASIQPFVPYPPFLTRQQAVRETLQKNGIEYDPRYELILTDGEAMTDVPALMKELLQKQPVDAILTNSDSWAITTLYALRSIGIRVPQDISIVGFDGWWKSGQTIPSLTTVRQPVEEIGRKAVDLLLRHAEATAPEPEQLLVMPELIRRDSVCERKYENINK